MRQLFFVVSLVFINSCSSYPNSSLYSSELISSFDVFNSNLISWESILKQHEKSYFVYVFSHTCQHCLEIKSDIRNFANNSVYPIYLVEFNKSIPVGTDIENTIGILEFDKLFIKGTPTLLLIEDGMISINIAGSEMILQTIDLYKN